MAMNPNELLDAVTRNNLLVAGQSKKYEELIELWKLIVKRQAITATVADITELYSSLDRLLQGQEAIHTILNGQGLLFQFIMGRLYENIEPTDRRVPATRGIGAGTGVTGGQGTVTRNARSKAVRRGKNG